MSDDENKVGYGRPPKEHQFQKGGKSPNPNGRPRRSGRPDVVTRIMKRRMNLTIEGRRQRVTYSDALILKMFHQAMEGDHRAALTLFRLWQLEKAFGEPQKSAAQIARDEAEQEQRRALSNELVHLLEAEAARGKPERSRPRPEKPNV